MDCPPEPALLALDGQQRQRSSPRQRGALALDAVRPLLRRGRRGALRLELLRDRGRHCSCPRQLALQRPLFGSWVWDGGVGGGGEVKLLLWLLAAWKEITAPVISALALPFLTPPDDVICYIALTIVALALSM